MKAERKPVFTGSDAWLLLSIAMAQGRGSATLPWIIAVGDYINHDIFTGDEIRRGLAKLLHSDFVRGDGGGFRIHGRAAAAWRTIRKPRKPPMRMLEEWERFLEVPSLRPADPAADDGWDYAAVSDEMVRQAYEDYRTGAHVKTDITGRKRAGLRATSKEKTKRK